MADPGHFKEAVKKIVSELRSHPFTSGPLNLHGSVSTVAVTLNTGIMPADNWQRSARRSRRRGLLGNVLRDHYLVKDVAVRRSVPVALQQGHCGARWPLRRRHFTEGPEYETVYAARYLLRHLRPRRDDPRRQLCDLYGIDTISVGVTISFAMECFERGLLTQEDTGGHRPPLRQRRSDAAAGTRRRFPAWLRRDRSPSAARALAAEIGQGSEVFAMHAKGMEIGGYDPRGAKGMALVYGCGPRGGCHHAGGYTVTAELSNPAIDRFADSGKAPIALVTRNRRAAAADSACTCAFLPIGMQDATLAEHDRRRHRPPDVCCGRHVSQPGAHQRAGARAQRS